MTPSRIPPQDLQFGWQPGARRAHIAAFLLSGGLVAAGSLTPFEWSGVHVLDAISRFYALWLAPAAPASRIDTSINVALMIPVAYCLLGTFHLGFISRGPVFLLATMTLGLCTSLAVLVEFLQMFVAGRVSAPTDVLAQFAGAVIGVLAWYAFGMRLASALLGSRSATPGSSSLYQRLLLLYSLGFLAYSLLPLDFTFDPHLILAKFQSGQVLLVPFQFVSGDLTPAVMRWLADTAMWIPIGALAARLARSMRAPGLVLISVATPFTLEVAHLFLVSRVSEVTDVIFGAVGMATGAALGRSWADEKQLWRWLVRPSGVTGVPVIWLLLAAYSIFLVLGFTYPHNFSPSEELIAQGFEQLARPPFASYQEGALAPALFSAIRTTVAFLFLGALCGACISTLRTSSRLLLSRCATVLLACGLSASIQMAKLGLPEHVSDSTDILIAAVASLVGFQVVFNSSVALTDGYRGAR